MQEILALVISTLVCAVLTVAIGTAAHKGYERYKAWKARRTR